MSSVSLAGALLSVSVSPLLAGCGSSEQVSGVRPIVPGDTTVAQLPPLQTTRDTARITVDNSTAFQQIAGFGGTTMPLVYGGVDYLGALRARTIETVFKSVGISHGLLQVGLTEAPASGTDPFSRRANDNDDPFVINPAGFNFAGLTALRTAVVQPGAAFGYREIELGPMLNVRFVLDWLKAVRASNYNRYLDESAESVLAALQQWRTATGSTPALIHLFNEPTSGNVELESNSVQEVVDLVKRVGTRLRAEGFANVRFIVPNEETMRRSLEVSRAILADPVARPFVGAIGFHQYPYGSVSSSPRLLLATSGTGAPDAGTRAELEELRSLGAQYGVPLWMTEVSEGPAGSDYPFDAIEHVLARSIHIHDTFRYGGVQAYFGMNTMWDSRSHAEHFAGRSVPFLNETASIVLVDLDQSAVRISGMGYAIGHYARWLGEGAVRLETTSDATRVIALAFRDVAARRVIVVSTNADDNPRLLRVRLNGATPGSAFTGEASYGTTRWQAVSGIVNATTGIAEFVAPPRSVVTLAIPYR